MILTFHLSSSSAGYVLVTRWGPVRQGVNDDPVYAEVAAPKVEKLNFATSDSPNHDAFSSCGSSDLVVFTLVAFVSCIGIFGGKLNGQLDG